VDPTSVRDRCEAFLAEERSNWPGWLAVALGLGIVAYFALPFEPPLWLGGGMVTLATAAAIGFRRNAIAVIAISALLTAAVGFTVGTIRTILVASPQLQDSIRFAHVTGRLIAIQPLPNGMRAIFDNVTIAELPAVATPARVQLKLVKGAADLRLGDRLDLLANLQPPAPPAAPGAFDFRRQSYFQRLGATGFVLGTPRYLARAGGDMIAIRLSLWTRCSLWIGRLRSDIGRRIAALEPGEAGAMARALTVGDQTALAMSDINAMRISGLAHLLSISGLHIGMAAGLFFLGLRTLLALVPRLALRYPIKKWSAAAAILAAGFYSLLADPTVPTQRSFVMVAVVFLGVIMDRAPFSLRMLAWAAIVILLFQPESLISASFQMSFFSVLGLIAAFEAMRNRLTAWRGGRSAATDWFGRLSDLARGGGFWLMSMTLTSVVATIMTGPFAMYHFDRLSTYGVVANMLAVPLTGFWVMPMGMAALLLMPFGLDAPFWHLMAWGCEGILWIARAVAAWPYAVVLTPAMPAAALFVLTLGLTTLCLMRSRWRLLGILPMLAGVLSTVVIAGPDLLVSADARLIAVKDWNGVYLLSSGRAERLAAETWLRRNGQAAGGRFPAPGDPAEGPLACENSGCRYQRRGRSIAVAFAADALGTACRNNDVVLSVVPSGDGCAGRATIIDRDRLWRGGATAIWIGPRRSLLIESVAATLGDRPWVLERMRQVLHTGDPDAEPAGKNMDADADAGTNPALVGNASSAE
jgi:competence protein ComEC